MRDDLVDDGEEHAEGILDGPGLRAGGTDWTPIPAAGVVAHGLRQVFGRETRLHPLAEVGRYTWRATRSRPGRMVCKVPDAGRRRGASRPRSRRWRPPGARRSADVLPPREDVPAGADVSGYQRAPRRERAAAR